MSQQQAAETTALRALGWLVGNDDLLPAFLAASGADLADLRARAAEPGFLASVLDFLLTEDAHVLAFCDATGLAYDAPMQARIVLAGNDRRHWT